MSASELKDLRETLGLTHEDMGKRLGMKLEDYLALESGARRFTRLHTLAYERIALGAAADLKDPNLAPAAVRRAALRLGEVVLHQNRPPAGT